MFGGSSIRDFKKTDGVSGNFQQNFKVYGKIILNVLDMAVMDIFKRFYCPTDQPFIVQNVRSNDNK